MKLIYSENKGGSSSVTLLLQAWQYYWEQGERPLQNGFENLDLETKCLFLRRI